MIFYVSNQILGYFCDFNLFYYIFVQTVVAKRGYKQWETPWLDYRKNRKIMKKSIFCVALVAAMFLAIPANAQSKFGPKVGVVVSTLSL